MKFIFAAIATMLTLVQPLAAEDINLLKLKEDFVLQTKRIVVPGFPKAFNPSIVRWQGRLLMCFRTYDPITRSTDDIYLAWLDDDFQVVGKPMLLRREGEVTASTSQAQDARLIIVHNKVYVVYSNVYPDPVNSRRMYVGHLEPDFDDGFKMSFPAPLTHFYGQIADRKEKNWIPFSHDNRLHLAYSIQPHRIFIPITDLHSCLPIGSTIGAIQWNWGNLFGGTPALRVGNSYLAFFHSNKAMASVQSGGEILNHYFMGAYTFNRNYPFALTGISPKPIVARTFYEGEMYEKDTWKPLRVVFPGGFVVDDNFVWVVYGRQDHESWVVKLDKAKLFKSLEPVQTVKHSLL